VPDYLASAHRAPSALETVGSEPKRLWSAKPGRGIAGLPAYGERIIGVTTVDRYVAAIDARNGQTFWRQRADGSFGSGPAMSRGLLVTVSEGRSGRLAAYDLYSGKKRWDVDVGDAGAPPLIVDSVVYVSTQSGGLIATQLETGKRLWVRAVGPSRSGVMRAGAQLATITLGDSLVVVRADRGTIVTRRSVGLSTIAPMVLADDSTLIVSSVDSAVVALAIPSGIERWRVHTSAPVFGAPAFARDTIFALDAGCRLYAIPSAAPTHVASWPLGCAASAGPTPVKNGVLVTTVSGELLFVDASRTVRWRRDLGGEMRHPAQVRGGHILIGAVLGDLASWR
jgi:outer membrane protein assembly factor BamB